MFVERWKSQRLLRTGLQYPMYRSQERRCQVEMIVNRNQLVMFSVHCRNVIAKLQRCYPDGEILERHRETTTRQFALQTPAQSLQGNRIDGNLFAQPVNERQPSLLFRACSFSSVGAVHEFGDCNDGNAKVNSTKRSLRSAQVVAERPAVHRRSDSQNRGSVLCG